MTGPLVRTEGLRGGYGAGEPALRDVGFAAGPGELVAVLGPNGGGKSTLLRALLGELPVREGVVEIAGRPAYVPQTERSRLDFPVTALDVVLMGAYARTPWWRRVSAADRAAARRALDHVDLSDRASEGYGSLSGGQRQRALIARALLQDAHVMLLDEPFSGVDQASAARIERLFDDLRREGRAVLVTTHDIDQARRCDQVLCLNRTQVAYGPPAATLSRDVLKRTYGAELVVLDGEREAVAVHHHGH